MIVTKFRIEIDSPSPSPSLSVMMSVFAAAYIFAVAQVGPETPERWRWHFCFFTLVMYA